MHDSSTSQQGIGSLDRGLSPLVARAVDRASIERGATDRSLSAINMSHVSFVALREGT
jgi:hypothetical protein